MRRCIALIAITLCALEAPALAGTFTLSFDDAPRGDTFLEGRQRTEKLIKGLSEAGIAEAVFYCNPGHADKQTVRRRLQAYAQAGHVIANHTYSHPSLPDVPADEYIAEIAKAHEKLKNYSTFEPWFRYPYLREGRKQPLKHAKIKSYLDDEGYLLGYVTVEIYDWHIDARIQQALEAGKTVDFRALRQAYLKVIRESVHFYETLAQKALDRSPTHVLLLHENDINALYIDDIVAMLEEQGFSPRKAHAAFEDPIAHPKWDQYPLSMRRIRLIAEKKGVPGSVSPKWTSTHELDRLLARYEVIKHNDL